MFTFEKVFSPGKIGTLTVPNRFTVTAAVTLTADEQGCATEHTISYYEAKAKGGWGLIITEDFAVDVSGKSFTRVPGLWDDSQITGYSDLTRRVHAYPSKIFCQIFHAGRQTTRTVLDGESPVAASRLIDPLNCETPRALTTAEVETLVVKFGDAAVRAQKAGFDGVEVHAGHGYLLNEFLSHYSNKRIDKYGGNILNRCRFATEVIQEIKRRCGADYPVGIRISAEEKVPGGLTIEDAKVISMLMVDAGVDYINVSAALNGSVGACVVPPAAVPHGVYTDYAEAVKKVVSVPVVGLGRINDPLLAESALLSEKCDFVGMLRASMADPELPKKVMENRIEDNGILPICG